MAIYSLGDNFGRLPYLNYLSGVWGSLLEARFALKTPADQAAVMKNTHLSFPAGFRDRALTWALSEGGIRAAGGGISGLTSIIQGELEGSATANGTSSLSAVLCGCYPLFATLSGMGTLDGSAIGGTSLVCNIDVGAQPTAEDIFYAVLNSPNACDGMSLKQTIQVLLAVAAGKTTITDLGGGLATVKFRDSTDTKDRVTASMDQSERTAVTINNS